jgi:signal transduction histidine kinase
MAGRISAHDWSATLGPVSSWSISLRTTVGLLLRTPVPMVLLWGMDGVMIYNDAYSVFAADRDATLLGSKVREGWAEVAEFNDHVMRAGLAGQALSYRNQELTLYRSGKAEQVWMNLDYSAVIDEDGRPAGVIAVVVETTDGVLAERRAAAERQRQLRMLQQMPGFAAVLTGPDFVYEFVNEAYVAISERTDFIGRRFKEVFPDIADQGFFELLDRVWRTGQAVVSRGMELRLHGAEAPQYIDFVFEPILEDGALAGVFIGGYETTDVYRGQALLRASEARLRFLDALATATSGLSDADEILATTTRLTGEHLGLSVCAYADMDEDQDGFTIRGDWSAPDTASIVGHYSLRDFGRLAVANLTAGRPLIVNDNRTELEPEAAAAFQSIGVTATLCMPLVKDGRLTALMAIHDKGPRRWTEEDLSLMQEVTERSWAHVERVGAEAELRASEARYRTLFEAIEVGFCLIDVIFDDDGRAIDYVFVEANPAFERQAGFPNAVGRRMRDIVPEHESEWFELFGRVATTGESARIEAGSTPLGRWWDIHAFKVAGATPRVAVLFNDATERHRNDLMLRELNDTLERRVAEALAERKVLADIVEGTDAFVQVLDPEFRWLAINRAAADEFEQIYGVRPRVGQTLAQALHDRPEHLAAVERVWRRALRGEAFTETADFGDPGLARRFYEMKYNPLHDADGRLIGAFQFVYDVTERIREQERLAQAEEQLRQSQKMEAIGQLTGGVAHDFNNLLTPIVGSLDILQRRRLGSEREQRLIAGAIQSAERAKTLVQRLLAFARRQPLQPTAVDVGALVTGMADLVASTSGPQIKVSVEIAAGLPAAKADPNQLEMALLNLSVNARDAMPNGGRLRISASAEQIGPQHPAGLAPGGYVRLSVADNGVGMDEATLARAVEPFFSTKGLGKGTGLGLSMVHGLAMQLGGALTIQASPGAGTNVELWLPLSDVAAAAPRPLAAAQRPALTGLALLVDDEELVRASTSEMLEELGYDVVQADSAEEALRMVSSGLRPSLLITDHLMPGMSGTQLAQALQSALPKALVLIISGYAELGGIDPRLARLTKPFRQEDLAASLTRLLARPEA